MPAYYNEIDKKAAAWLRELIRAGVIAPGEVDERSIVDVRGSDLAGFTQCHFFAGVGVWSYALRCAGWPDDRPAWTGSCPCQPFSAAGKGDGFADERHLWPSWDWLIQQRDPECVFGEQVASKDGLAWLDLVQADMEGKGYAFRANDLCAAGVGAPHIRQRLFFVADAAGRGRGIERDAVEPRSGGHDDGSGLACGLADTDGRDASAEGLQRGREHGQQPQDGRAGLVGDAEREGLEGLTGDGDYPRGRSFALGSATTAGATGGFWRDAHWVYCSDGKLRPVEPGTFPLAHGIAERVGRLRGYGNAIVAPLAKEFIESYLETRRSA